MKLVMIKAVKWVMLMGFLVGAQAVYAGQLIAEEGGWVRAVPPVSKNTAAYFTLNNQSHKKDTLLHLSSDAARHVEFHTIVVEPDGAKKMQKVPHATINPGNKLVMQPGGYHVMLIGLLKPLKEGDQVAVELIFNHAGKVQVTLPVKMASESTGDQMHRHRHHH
ncbi:MAG: hypothetical protein CSA49_00580 [Gammaproteobacteria bacterium]|nr:MAG: hypothetical protein CSA49_00580 [Gammaproteobacteria bacterium]